MDIIDIALSKKYTDDSIKGITGALAGKNCTIQSTNKADGITTVTFAWTADDGTENTTSIQVDDGAKGDKGDNGNDGVSITNVTVNDNNHLIITLSDGTTIDAGLIEGGSGTDDYEDLINKPKIDGVELVGNKTFEDLGIASATDLAQTDEDLQEVSDLVGDKNNLPMPNETVIDNIEYVDTKVDGLIDDNETGLDKTFSSDKITKTFATLEEVNERIPQYEIMPTATDACGGQVVQFIGTTTSDYTHNYFYECVQVESGYEWKNVGVQAIPANVSELTNDSGFITVNVDNLVNYYLKTETYSQSEVDELVGKLNRLTTEIVEELPTEDISTTTIYLIKVDDTNSYTQHMYISGAWSDLGSTDVSLDGYVTIQQLTTTLADYTKSTDFQAHVDNNTVHLTTEDRDNLTNLLLDEHNHANKTVLDSILQNQVDNWNEAFADKHTHTNKTVIDKFTESDNGIVLYNGKQIASGNLWHGTKEEYNAITDKDADTTYVVTDEDNTLADALIDDVNTSTESTWSSNKISSELQSRKKVYIFDNVKNPNPKYYKFSKVNRTMSLNLTALRVNTTTTLQQLDIRYYNNITFYEFLKLKNAKYGSNSDAAQLETSYFVIDENNQAYLQISSYGYGELSIISPDEVTIEVVDELPSDLLLNGYTEVPKF